jgi:hypothetical protein
MSLVPIPLFRTIHPTPDEVIPSKNGRWLSNTLWQNRSPLLSFPAWNSHLVIYSMLRAAPWGIMQPHTALNVRMMRSRELASKRRA